MAIEYTATEIEAKIKRFDERIDALLHTASQQGADGVYASFAGKITELQRERKIWEDRYVVAERREQGLTGGSTQGPNFELY